MEEAISVNLLEMRSALSSSARLTPRFANAIVIQRGLLLIFRSWKVLITKALFILAESLSALLLTFLQMNALTV